MRYRLLALDLDGTLLRTDQRVDDLDIAAISELQAAGVTVTIVTGRLHSGATGAATACAIEGAIACMEGSHPRRGRQRQDAAASRHGRRGRGEGAHGVHRPRPHSSFVFDASGNPPRSRGRRLCPATSARGRRTCASSSRTSCGRPCRWPPVAVGDAAEIRGGPRRAPRARRRAVQRQLPGQRGRRQARAHGARRRSDEGHGARRAV